jgi:TolB-like protein
MASIIPGYEYDIFISYRQKDNKHDGWVTDFVNNLKGELETTFKEEISVYFDINPHDGLLETHDVDASLKGKLKCLVFIPIISRTYCDPKSFAWVHEFRAFVENASDDKYGLRVKLAGGNIANRVLPIRIHDLDTDDISLCESLLSGMLRGIEFIYTELGVNRPLTQDDEIKTNLNKTRYRNQINKVALAVREIITSLRKDGQPSDAISDKTAKSVTVSESIEEFEKSIAVLPFINDSPDQENTYFINGVMEEILNNLKRIKDLRVISRTSAEHYRGEKKPISEIAQELGVNYIVEGSGQKYGNSFRLRTQLIKAEHESHLWGESFQNEINDVKDIFNIQIRIAKSIAEELKAVISPEEKRLIEKIPTADLAVYDEYLKAHSYWNDFRKESLNKALEFLNSGVEKNPGWAPLYAGLAEVWMTIQQGGFEPPSVTGPKIFENLNKAMELDPDLAETHYFNAIIAHLVEWDWEKSEKEFLKTLAINPNDSLSRILYSQLLAVLHRNDEALTQGELAFSLDPLNPNMKCWYAATLMCTGDYKTSLSLAEEALAADPGNLMAHSCIEVAAYRCKEYDKVIRSMKYNLPFIIEEDTSKEIERIYSESGIVPASEEILKHMEKYAENNYIQFLEMTMKYIYANQPDKAMDWIEKGFELHDPQMTYIATRLYNLDPLFGNPRFIAICEKMNLPLPKSN